MKYLLYFRLAAVLLAHAVVTPTFANNPETLSERSQKQANAVMDRAVEALGGAEAVNSVRAIRITTDAEIRTRLQMPTPKPPYEGGTEHEVLLLDVSSNRLRLDRRAQYSGANYRSTTIIRNGEGVVYDHLARTATPIPPARASQQTFVQHHRRLPNLIVRQALARANTLRYLGAEQFDGRMHDVVTFVMADTQQISLYVDSKTALISKYELVLVDPLAGRDVIEVRYADYAWIGKLNIPQRRTTYVAGEEGSRYTSKIEINPPLDTKSFEASDIADYVPIEPPSQNSVPFVETLAEGVYVLHHFAGQNLNTIAVVFKDYVLTVDAPGDSAGADAIIAKIKELAPGKPLRFVALTHHHTEHIGGLRSFIAEGAEIVTTRGNVELVKEMAQAPHNDRLARESRAPKISLVENGKRVFDDGTQRIELIDIGPNPHAREMVIAWLPKHKVVFQGDLFIMPYSAEPLWPAQPRELSFARALDERKLAAERIAGAHGRTVTRDEFDSAMRTTKGPHRATNTSKTTR